MKRCFFIAICILVAIAVYGCGPSKNPQVARPDYNIDKMLAGDNSVNTDNPTTGDSADKGTSSLSAKDMFEQGIIPEASNLAPVNAGNYTLDVNRTEAEMGGKISSKFDNYDKDGSAMKLADDGAFAFYVGKSGGAGTWKQDGACIKLYITDYKDAHQYEVVLNPFNDNGKEYFTLNLEGVNLYWYR